jgi:uncharacterized protein (TIGR02118 family)
MYKLYAIWTVPADADAFERYYEDTHVPIAAAIPGLRELTLVRTADGLGDATEHYHRVAELLWDSEAEFEAAQDTPEFAAAVADSISMQERFGVVLSSPAGDVVDARVGPLPA